MSEAFAGLALCAMHEGRVIQCVGYSTASLFKHHDALPMFNCSRLVAAVRQDMRALLYLTEMVLLPFYIRTKNDELYQKELSIWGPLANVRCFWDCCWYCASYLPLHSRIISPSCLSSLLLPLRLFRRGLPASTV